MPKESRGSRLKLFGLDDELIERVQDFREAYFGAQENRIIEEALEHFMRDRFKHEPQVKRRYDEARKSRGRK
jgi:hypothetical protein